MLMNERTTRIPSGCAVAGVFNKKKEPFPSTKIMDIISAMKERSNGLGGGFACYGLYQRNLRVFHVLFDDRGRRGEFEDLLKKEFLLEDDEPIPTRNHIIPSAPYFHRYFVHPQEEDPFQEKVLSFVMEVNRKLKDVYVISSGTNMGVFKGVGFPEEIGEFFALDQYKGYSWLGHGRFPTNTPGWWGGAHPFSFLEWSVIHNGEISSYDTNRRFLEMKGYHTTQQTDTEVIVSTIDYLLRKERLPFNLLGQVLAPTLWEQIDRLPKEERILGRVLRQMYGSLLLNGPFSIIIGFDGGIMALNDRLKLRPLVFGEGGDFLFFSSEEAAIRASALVLESISFPKGGELVGEVMPEKGDAA